MIHRKKWESAKNLSPWNDESLHRLYINSPLPQIIFEKGRNNIVWEGTSNFEPFIPLFRRSELHANAQQIEAKHRTRGTFLYSTRFTNQPQKATINEACGVSRIEH